MINTLPHVEIIDFDRFIDWYPEESEQKYELHDGMIVTMPKPKGKHSQIAGFLMNELGFETKKLGLPYFLPKESIVRIDDLSGYEPDIIVLKKSAIASEPRWGKESTIVFGESIQLIIEVVSTNWSDDYALKLDAYESMGIVEYWIVDYLGLGGRKFIGYPKQPTLTIYHLQEGEYISTQFRANQAIQSFSFPSLALTGQQIFDKDRLVAGEVKI
jgi:Uma2 family endonuclease